MNKPTDFQVTVYHDKVQLSFIDNSTNEEEFQIRNRTNISGAPWINFKNLSAQPGTSSNPRTINFTEFRDAESAFKRFRIRAVKKNFFGFVSESSDWVYNYNPQFIIPNLVVSNVSFNISTLSPCTIGVYFDVQNTGSYSSKSCSATATVGSNQKIISIPSLSPGEKRSFYTAITRDGIPIYNERVVVIVDTSDDNYETTNSDNTAQSDPITISPICGGSNSIDLTIASPSIASQGVQSIYEKTSLSSSFVVYNLKSDLASQSVVKIYWNTSSSLSGASLAATVTIPPVGGYNNTGSRSFTVKAPDIPTNSGFMHYYLIFVADAMNAITETNESNNRESYLFKINEVGSGGGKLPIEPEGPLDLLLIDIESTNSFEQDEGLLINPNPTVNLATLDVSGRKDEIVILKKSGNIVKRITVDEGQTKILLRNLKSGTYYAKSLKTNQTIRFVVK